MEWLRPSSARSNVTTSASARDRMPRPCCVSCRRGSHTTMRFTHTRLSVIVHQVSSLQLTKDLDRVRSFGGYNNSRCLAWRTAMNSGPTLTIGSTGPDVRRLQIILVMMKMLDVSAIDSVFGPKTQDAVKSFQQGN